MLVARQCHEKALAAKLATDSRRDVACSPKMSDRYFNKWNEIHPASTYGTLQHFGTLLAGKVDFACLCFHSFFSLFWTDALLRLQVDAFRERITSEVSVLPRGRHTLLSHTHARACVSPLGCPTKQTQSFSFRPKI